MLELDLKTLGIGSVLDLACIAFDQEAAREVFVQDIVPHLRTYPGFILTEKVFLALHWMATETDAHFVGILDDDVGFIEFR